MPQSVRAVVLVIAALFACWATAATPRAAAATEPAANSTTVLYVSTGGNDEWSGRRPARAANSTDGPFATLTGARDAIRALKRQRALEGAIVVMVLEGTYELHEPLLITAEDSGTDDRPVTYTAFPGHRPVLSGGMRIDDWRPYKDQVLQADLRQVRNDRVRFRQVFYRGQRQPRARWPNPDRSDALYSGWAFIEAAQTNEPLGFNTHHYSADQPMRPWSRVEQAEINLFPWYCWVNDIIPLTSVDAASQTITLARPAHFDFMPLLPGNRFCVENVLEELDRPGEWCLRSDTDTLYFWPPDGMQPGDVVVPVLDSLIELRGTADARVRHITISGLTLAHTGSAFPERQHASHHSPGPGGAGITLEYCEDCRIMQNRLTLLGGDGVRLQGENSRHEIVGNEIHDVGGSGVVLASNGEMNTETWTDAAALRQHSAAYPRLTRNVITDNEISACGRIKKNCAGVQLFAINSIDTRIAHNHIHDMSDKGLVMQDGYGRFIAEYNELNQLGQEIADTGGIMVNRWFALQDDAELGQGNVIRFNRIRNCIGCGAYAEARHPKGEGDRTVAGGRIWTPYYTWGIYFDNSGLENLVFGNIVESTVLGAVALPVGSPKNNRIENNIFIGGSGNQLDLRMGGENNRCLRNIIYYADAKAALLAAQPNAPASIAECDFNLYFLATGEMPAVRGVGGLGDWQKLGFDLHSMVADPRFVDVEHGNYQLQPDSPAFGLGFQPIPVDDIGPRTRRWVETKRE